MSDYVLADDPLPWLTPRFVKAGCFATDHWQPTAAAITATLDILSSVVNALHDDARPYSVGFGETVAGFTKFQAHTVGVGGKILGDTTLTYGQRAAIFLGVVYHEVGHIRFMRRLEKAIVKTFGSDPIANKMANFASDISDEAAMARIFPGYAESLQAVAWYAGNRGKPASGRPDFTTPTSASNEALAAMRFPWIRDWTLTKERRDWQAWWLVWATRAEAATKPKDYLKVVADGVAKVNHTVEEHQPQPEPTPEPEPQPDPKDQDEDEDDGDKLAEPEKPEPDDTDTDDDESDKSDESDNEPKDGREDQDHDSDEDSDSEADDDEHTDGGDDEPTEGESDDDADNEADDSEAGDEDADSDADEGDDLDAEGDEEGEGEDEGEAPEDGDPTEGDGEGSDGEGDDADDADGTEGEGNADGGDGDGEGTEGGGGLGSDEPEYDDPDPDFDPEGDEDADEGDDGDGDGQNSTEGDVNLGPNDGDSDPGEADAATGVGYADDEGGEPTPLDLEDCASKATRDVDTDKAMQQQAVNQRAMLNRADRSRTYEINVNGEKATHKVIRKELP